MMSLTVWPHLCNKVPTIVHTRFKWQTLKHPHHPTSMCIYILTPNATHTERERERHTIGRLNANGRNGHERWKSNDKLLWIQSSAHPKCLWFPGDINTQDNTVWAYTGTTESETNQGNQTKNNFPVNYPSIMFSGGCRSSCAVANATRAPAEALATSYILPACRLGDTGSPLIVWRGPARFQKMADSQWPSNSR